MDSIKGFDADLEDKTLSPLADDDADDSGDDELAAAKVPKRRGRGLPDVLRNETDTESEGVGIEARRAMAERERGTQRFFFFFFELLLFFLI